ncbi:MAG: hypothetical protein GY941_17470 [Planctomycetes bacterium]|nr:hypothetical protein [Planctomycetota bacterium]
MSRFHKISQTIRRCQYHIVWTPEYRIRILTGRVTAEVNRCIRVFSEQNSCEIIEVRVQISVIRLGFCVIN